ncbi:hypothetical protein B14911_20953 [Bacillus sp. NRRL B-14911]|uniref:ABC transporter n=1 Tax=Bacillus infantis NRRL B-14911 TaxID=1367477 RepID=U5L7R0_9BACI|nr:MULTISPECIES: ABC transporter permease [Bacillus]AGX03393.1 ABC transporter [Bacillus infantis NRRL B-14911]EAR66315.1 hypothetical protein B14911_20953 [Bacillus sp. NRRL B-14911]
MLFQMIKKDLLLFWRKPRELIILLLMPFVLICILGNALGALNSDEIPDLDIKLAVWVQDDYEAGAAEAAAMIKNFPMPDEAKEEAVNAVEMFNPAAILIEEVFGDEEFSRSIGVDYISEELDSERQEEYSALLTIPSGFTTDYYRHSLLKEGDLPELELQLNDSDALRAGVIRDFLANFQEQISLWQGIQTLGISAVDIKEAGIHELGAIESVSKVKDVSSVSYYAIGMSMMFVFYVATTAASFAYTQKEEHLYNRILLADVPNSIFFSGIFSAAAIVCFLQLNILFGLSALFFDVSYPDIMDYLIITGVISIMIGSFASLLSAVNYRSSSERAGRVFGNFLVPVFAFVGGSFFPVSQLGGIFESLGSYSPGGAGISAYMKILQGYPLGETAGQLWSLAVFSAILLFAALLLQPRKGEAA